MNHEIAIETMIHAPVRDVWEYWTNPDHIMKWSRASEEWFTSSVENEVRPGGRFYSRMESRDGTMGYNFSGRYDEVVPGDHLFYTLDDGRKVQVYFFPEGDHTRVRQTFETENGNPFEMQQKGWQAILDHFKAHAESEEREKDIIHSEPGHFRT